MVTKATWKTVVRTHKAILTRFAPEFLRQLPKYPLRSLIYLRPTDALNLEFLVEVTDDLGSWLGGDATIDLVSVTDNGDGTETVVVRDKTPLTDTGRFLRLTVNRTTE